MEFCRNCGSKLIEGHQFCAECGEPVKLTSQQVQKPKEETPVKQTRSQEVNHAQTPIPPKQPLFKSKKSKVLTIISVIVIALLAGGYYFVKDMTSPTSVAEGFIHAIDSKDSGKVKGYINGGQYEKITDKEVKAFLSYLHEHPQMLSAITDGLLADAESLEEGSAGSISEDSNSYASLKKNGKKWLLFDHYSVKMETYYLEVATSHEKTEIYVNDEKKATIDDDKTIGPLLPGEYKIKAVIDGEYGKVEDEIKIETEDFEDETDSIRFDWSDFYVYVYSNHDDAILYVNNKSTESEIGDIDELGPVPLDGSVKLFVQKKFGEEVKKSKVVTLKKNTTDAELYIEYDDTALIEDYDYDSIDATNDAANIHATILQHYESISNDDFASAYDKFSSSYQSKVTFEGWTKGLQQNIKDEVTKLEISNIEGTTAKANVEMTSYDEQPDGKTLVQEWGGTWNLVKESDGWKLEKAQLEKLASRTE
ncbi:zinc ribbon domain-containing protein [Metabacillus malikii]|uniref:Membrane-associated protein n=1 Tax=Metabacillus malikii TaxID=1504265 RepID=A0ABT9ZAK1_9BACI|nr:hypothetical protein [Metabacillus malikii]MDQ0229286.1 putative membrane protein YvbJ [Metabacillus malikii]